MTRSRPPHQDIEPAEEGAARNGPETEIIAVAIGDGRGGGPTDTELSPRQHDLLATLTHLHHSLRGPQTLLEAAGHFSRPPFPPPPRDDSTDTFGHRS